MKINRSKLLQQQQQQQPMSATSRRLCLRIVKAVLLASLAAFLLTTALPFFWMLRNDDRLAETSIVSPQIKSSVSRAMIEFQRPVFKSQAWIQALDSSVAETNAEFSPQDNRDRAYESAPEAGGDPTIFYPLLQAVHSELEATGELTTIPSEASGAPPLGLSADVKVYIYDLPAEYNVDWLRADPRCSRHLFAAEVAIHQNLLRSPVRTLDPEQAHYFYMPVYVSCNFSTKTGFPILSNAAAVLESAVKRVSEAMPYWNRSNGRDHIFVATHDYGACFHAMEDLAVALGIPHFLRNSIILQTFAKRSSHPCQKVDHIQIPPYVVPLETLPDPRAYKRNIFAFFRGKMEIHPKNVSGHMYSRGVRTVIWKKFSHDRKSFFIKRKRSSAYREEMLRSVFCLCPLGWAPWSPRIVESVLYGCVPVIIADRIALPYDDDEEGLGRGLGWAGMSVTVAERDVGKLGRILRGVAATNLSAIQSNLWRPEVRRALVYSARPTRGDATWHILEALARRRINRQQGLSTREAQVYS